MGGGGTHSRAILELGSPSESIAELCYTCSGMVVLHGFLVVVLYRCLGRAKLSGPTGVFISHPPAPGFSQGAASLQGQVVA